MSYRVLPLMLEQVKLKGEDYEKFKKDQIEPEILEKVKKMDRMTIRSRACKAIETISSKIDVCIIL